MYVALIRPGEVPIHGDRELRDLLVVIEEAHEGSLTITGYQPVWNLLSVLRLSQRIKERLQLIVDVTALPDQCAGCRWLQHVPRNPDR